MTRSQEHTGDGREFRYRWEFQLVSSPEALWPLVADTDRFDRDIGLPALTESPGAPPGKRRLSFRQFGMTITWDEEPFEWLRPQRFGVRRAYLSGPLHELRVLAELSLLASGGTHLTYLLWIRPRNWIGRIGIPWQIKSLGRKFERVFRQYDAALAQERALPKSEVRLAAGAEQRLADFAKTVPDRAKNAMLGLKMCDRLLTSDDMEVFRMRPYALADAWRVPRRDVLSVFLHATRAGLLDLRWEVLCPLCRGAKQSAATLNGLQSRVHCDACQIDFDANFDRLVELVFNPNPAIRSVQVGQYCVGGPQLTPHIVFQQRLPAGAEQAVAMHLQPGRHRLRTAAAPGGRALVAAPGGLPELRCELTPAGWPDDEPQVNTQVELVLRNATNAELLIILERMAWNDQAATAADVTALQTFRDLFASEALRPGEQFSVGTVTIVFTDLCDSTRLYQQIGDAPAFGCVMSHFDVLKETIARHNGAIVKTIGDAVMAVFAHSVDAMRAVLEAQSVLGEPCPPRPALQLKAGLHRGPCIAVTLNDRLDYFGSTVNLAARLAGEADEGAVILSSPVYEDKQVAACLSEHAAVRATPLRSELKGFDDKSFVLWRVETSER